ncbi:MAG: hypothetical protein ACKOWF_07330 [Chloroflexota bacterium]
MTVLRDDDAIPSPRAPLPASGGGVDVPPAPPRSRRTFIAAVAASALLAGCGRAAPPQADDPPVAPPPAAELPRSDDPTPAPGEAQPRPGSPAAAQPGRSTPAGPIIWTTGTDPATGAPLSQLERIDPGAPQIIASLPVALGDAPVMVSADWSYNNTDMPAFRSEHTLEAGAGVIWVSFALESTPGSAWPVGRYRVLVSFDAAPAAVGAVDVGSGA